MPLFAPGAICRRMSLDRTWLEKQSSGGAARAFETDCRGYGKLVPFRILSGSITACSIAWHRDGGKMFLKHRRYQVSRNISIAGVCGSTGYRLRLDIRLDLSELCSDKPVANAWCDSTRPEHDRVQDLL